MGSLAQKSSGAIRCSCNTRFRRRFRRVPGQMADKVPEGSGADGWWDSRVAGQIADEVPEGSGVESWWGPEGSGADGWWGSRRFRGRWPKTFQDLPSCCGLRMNLFWSYVQSCHHSLRRLSIAATSRKLGDVAARTGDLNMALHLLEESLQMQRSVHGEGAHPDIAGTLSQLGDVTAQTGDLKKSLQYLEASLRMQYSLHGEIDHPDIATTLHKLGDVTSHTADLKKAKEYLEASLKMQLKLITFETTTRPQEMETNICDRVAWYEKCVEMPCSFSIFLSVFWYNSIFHPAQVQELVDSLHGRLDVPWPIFRNFIWCGVRFILFAKSRFIDSRAGRKTYYWIVPAYMHAVHIIYIMPPSRQRPRGPRPRSGLERMGNTFVTTHQKNCPNTSKADHFWNDNQTSGDGKRKSATVWLGTRNAWKCLVVSQFFCQFFGTIPSSTLPRCRSWWIHCMDD